MTIGRVNTPSLNLRDQPDGQILAILIGGTTVEMLTPALPGNWLFVSAEVSGRTFFGWVARQFVEGPGAGPIDPGSSGAGGSGPGLGGASSSGDLAAQLGAQIASGRIIFDNNSLRDQLLGGSSGGIRVTAKLQSLVLKLSTMTPIIRISSLIRPAAGSHHAVGRAVDIGNEEIAGALLPLIATPQKVAELEIDELIFDARIIDPANDKNKFNFDQGVRHRFNDATINEHGNHIHFAVKADSLS